MRVMPIDEFMERNGQDFWIDDILDENGEVDEFERLCHEIDGRQAAKEEKPTAANLYLSALIVNINSL